MIYTTLQNYIIKYEVPAEEVMRFEDMLENGEDTSQYEVYQEFIGERVIHTSN